MVEEKAGGDLSSPAYILLVGVKILAEDFADIGCFSEPRDNDVDGGVGNVVVGRLR